jgi:hypothetical protein
MVYQYSSNHTDTNHSPKKTSQVLIFTFSMILLLKFHILNVTHIIITDVRYGGVTVDCKNRFKT